MHRLRDTVVIAPLACLVAAAPAQLDLYWADEFDGPALDTSVWEYQIGTGAGDGLPGWGNNELEYYTNQAANIFIQDGMLHIVANDNHFGGANFTSARIRTRGNLDFTYGRVEARMDLPKGQGIWPAFWMLPTDSPYGGWASSGEIDIMESINQMTTVYGTLHFGDAWPNNQSAGGNMGGMDFSQAFHVYAVEWEPNTVRWSVDGNVYRTLSRSAWNSSSAPGNPRAPFDNPFHILLNVAVGGNWPGNPDGSTTFPQEMVVDWVRVYRLAQSPFPGAPHAVPGRIEAEDFDIGYPDEAFHDCDPDNNGGVYRPDSDVDIEACSEGGFNLGWLCAGEWTEYTVDVAQSGTYTLRARVASQNTGGALMLESDGVQVSGPMVFLNTGGWQSWTTVETQVELEAGEQVFRLVNVGGAIAEFNINWIELEQENAGCNIADVAPPFGTLDFSDVIAFLTAFGATEASADLAPPLGVLDFSDVIAFLTAFGGGCP
ncbi:MAG: family 16 glycosylhydrolase [Phycisphaerales bacterium]